MFIRRSLALCVVTLLSACTSAAKYEISQDWNQADLATVAFYRTDTLFHSLNPERPFFYIDEKEVGKLGTGKAITTKVTPGKHVLTVRESILFMPAHEVGRIENMFEGGKVYYVRYSLEGSFFARPGTSMQTEFSLADESSYNDKR